MSKVLTDVYSIVVLQKALSADEKWWDMSTIEDSSNVIQNLVLCDKILLEAEKAREWNVTDVSKHFQGLFEFLESGAEYGVDISTELKALRTYSIYRYYDSAAAQGGFLSRANDYLALARKLGVYLSLHPIRSDYLGTLLGKTPRQFASQVAISHFDKRLVATEAAKYAGVDLSVPAVVEYVMAFATKNRVDVLTAANEVRHSKNAIRFRERCGKVDEELADFSGRTSVLALQKLVREIDDVASKWESDLDEGVKYVRREISLRKVWGLGSILESIGIDKITVKDPVIFSGHADLLFLNDLYRGPHKRQT